mmetsp:Transcript_11644/g.27744  ORF Transcript_11644/g.27744 Transcript_11644/m.27744 type:complete len:203 (+) Transcript_11644:828-1436(+)
MKTRRIPRGTCARPCRAPWDACVGTIWRSTRRTDVEVATRPGPSSAAPSARSPGIAISSARRTTGRPTRRSARSCWPRPPGVCRRSALVLRTTKPTLRPPRTTQVPPGRTTTSRTQPARPQLARGPALSPRPATSGQPARTDRPAQTRRASLVRSATTGRGPATRGSATTSRVATGGTPALRRRGRQEHPHRAPGWTITVAL